MRILAITFLAIFLLAPADTFAQRKKKQRAKAAAEAEVSPQTLDLQLEASSVFDQMFTGFALYDPAAQKMLYEYQADKYFTPASNTKILTLYACLQMLGDSVPALLFEKQGNLNIVWGTGDPSFLNPHLTQNPAVFDFLKNIKGDLLFCGANFRDQRFGSGWMWSDFPYSYQAEKTPFPVYGNVAHFYQKDPAKGIEAQPKFLRDRLRPGPVFDEGDRIGRAELANDFMFSDLAAGGGRFEEHVPFHYTPGFLAEALADTLHRPVGALELGLLPSANARVLYSLHADSLYRLMMQESDNHVAEQLLLLCSQWRLGHINTEEIIEYARKTFLFDLPDEPKWVDGSGLSRYNLLTPRSQVVVLEKIYRKMTRERLFGIFPAGGVNGTIEEHYRNGDKPYVFAKTGTLRNNHCLSGYLLTKKGNVLIFSFMHNNFTGGTSQIKQEMERYLKEVYETF